MEMYNADGSRGEMCGNGIRCVGKYAYDHGLVRKEHLLVETDAGIKALDLHLRDSHVDEVTVDMGTPSIEPTDIGLQAESPLVDAPLEANHQTYHVTCVSMGNPHCVLFVESAESAPVTSLGPIIERLPLFSRRTNVEFVELLEPAPSARLRMRVWERGSGETAACGTGACAAVVAAALTQRGQRSAEVTLNGGRLAITWRESDGHVLMRGGATEVFSGEIEV
jgi:diaminopimelate epimerase